MKQWAERHPVAVGVIAGLATSAIVLFSRWQVGDELEPMVGVLAAAVFLVNSFIFWDFSRSEGKRQESGPDPRARLRLAGAALVLLVGLSIVSRL